MAEINEALGRKGYYFEVNQPLCDFIQHDIVQSRRAIGRPGVGGRDNNAKNPDPAHSSKSRASFLNRANSSVVTSLQHEAEDITQGFFALLLERRHLHAVRKEKGRLRSYLLKALKHFLEDHRRHEMAVKRGRRQRFIPLAELRANEQVDPVFARTADSLSADQLYERCWALTL